MFDALLLLSMFMLSLSIVVCLFRIIKGPTLHDRVLALDSISYSVIGIVAIVCIMLDTHAFLETILLIGILAFLSTIALCRFIERGAVIEHKSDR